MQLGEPIWCYNCGTNTQAFSSRIYDDRVGEYFCDVDCLKEHLDNDFNSFVDWYLRGWCYLEED